MGLNLFLQDHWKWGTQWDSNSLVKACKSTNHCYIIKEWFSSYYYFLLIMFYHSIWLGFELFRLKVQVYSQLVQFMFARKGYDTRHCHNKLPDRKWGWSVDDVIPGRDGPENLRILKKSQLGVEFWPLEMELGIWPLSWVFWISTGRDELRSKTPRDVLNDGSGVSIVWLRKTFKNCFSLLVSKKRSQKLINVFVPETKELPAFVYVPLDWYHYDYRGYTIPSHHPRCPSDSNL